ncbi:hypothetical protein, partial [Pseudomonas syringae]
IPKAKLTPAQVQKVEGISASSQTDISADFGKTFATQSTQTDSLQPGIGSLGSGKPQPPPNPNPFLDGIRAGVTLRKTTAGSSSQLTGPTNELAAFFTGIQPGRKTPFSVKGILKKTEGIRAQQTSMIGEKPRVPGAQSFF